MSKTFYRHIGNNFLKIQNISTLLDCLYFFSLNLFYFFIYNHKLGIMGDVNDLLILCTLHGSRSVLSHRMYSLKLASFTYVAICIKTKGIFLFCCPMGTRFVKKGPSVPLGRRVKRLNREVPVLRRGLCKPRSSVKAGIARSRSDPTLLKGRKH